MAAKGRKGGRIIILVALILILALGGAYVYLQMQQGNASQAPEAQTPVVQMVSIVVTAQSIPRGATITQDSLTTIDYPADKLVQGTFITDMSTAVGSRAKYDLDPGVPLTKSVLIEPSGGSVASFDVPVDYVAMPIPVSRLSSVDNALSTGDHVMVISCMMLVDVDPDFQSELPNSLDVIISPGATGTSGGSTASGSGTTDTTSSEGDTLTAEGTTQGRAELDPTLNTPLYLVPGEDQRPRTVCQTLIQDAVVLRTGQYTEPVTQPADTTNQDQNTAPQQTVSTTNTVTLVVSPQDAVTLNYVLLTGDGSKNDISLNLALRNPSDTQPIVTDAVTLQYLMDQKNIPLPAKLPYALEPRVDSLNFPEIPIPTTNTTNTQQ